MFERGLEDRSYPYCPTELDIASHLGDLGMFYKALNAMFSQTVIKGRSHWVWRIHNRYCFVFLMTVYVVGNSLLRSQWEVDLCIEVSVIVTTAFLIIEIFWVERDHNISASLLMSWIIGLHYLVRYLLCVKFCSFVVL